MFILFLMTYAKQRQPKISHTDRFRGLGELIEFAETQLTGKTLTRWRKRILQRGGRGALPGVLPERQIRTHQDEVRHLLAQVIAVRRGGRYAALSLPVSWEQPPQTSVKSDSRGGSYVVIEVDSSAADRFRSYVARVLAAQCSKLRRCPSPKPYMREPAPGARLTASMRHAHECGRPFVKTSHGDCCSRNCQMRRYMRTYEPGRAGR
jgi:hypothetical protein